MAKPPFTAETAWKKVKAAQDLWNTKDPAAVVKAYTSDSAWRNRSELLQGHAEIVAFLERKWAKEQHYRLRKELFAYGDDRIAVQFWYEYQDAETGKWHRAYGIEHWTFAPEGQMRKRQASINDVYITDDERWFKDDVDVNEVDIGEAHW